MGMEMKMTWGVLAAMAMALAAGAVPVSSAARGVDANPMRPGAWEVRTESSASGSPGSTKTNVVCVDQGWVNDQAIYAPSDKAPVKEALSCKNEGYKRSPGASSWTTVCALAGGAEARVAFERQAGAESVLFVSDMRATVDGLTKRVAVRTAMRRIGDQCPDGASRLTAAKPAAVKR